MEETSGDRAVARLAGLWGFRGELGAGKFVWGRRCPVVGKKIDGGFAAAPGRPSTNTYSPSTKRRPGFWKVPQRDVQQPSIGEEPGAASL